MPTANWSANEQTAVVAIAAAVGGDDVAWPPPTIFHATQNKL